MMYLYPSGGFVDFRFGIITTPSHRGIAKGIKSGMLWAADNEAYTKKFNPDVFFVWLKKFISYKDKCLFASAPDIVGDAYGTIELFDKWIECYKGWPVAFVAQDGQEKLDFPNPNKWTTLFIGGSTKWKMSDSAHRCILRAQELGKSIHIGRVNYKRRYDHFRSIQGSERWTCDGTRTKYEKDKAISDWIKYMASPKQYSLFISRSDNSG